MSKEYTRQPMFTITETDSVNNITIRKDIEDTFNNTSMKNIVSDLKELDGDTKINTKDKNKKVTEILIKNKEILINNKQFLNFYYWLTDLSLNNLLESKLFDYKNTTTLNTYIKPLIFDNLGVYIKCYKCHQIMPELIHPSSRTNMKALLLGNYLCDDCKEKQRIEKEEKERIAKEQEELRKNEVLKLCGNFNQLSTNIIVTKYNDNFYIDFENKQILSLITNDLINLINNFFEIDKIDISNPKQYYKKDEEAGILVEHNKDILSNYLFATIYTYFMNMKFKYLYELCDDDVLARSTSSLIVRIVENNKVIKEEIPTSRSCSKAENYTQFKLWLNSKYPNGFTFENLFSENNFDESILVDKEEISNLRSMPYQDYLKTDHWKQIRKKALNKANYKCEVCNSDEELNVHHKTYENRGNERMEDLIVLCHDCHAKFHNKLAQEESKDTTADNNNNDKFIEYLKQTSLSALYKRAKELNDFYGFEFILNINIDINKNCTLNKILNKNSNK